jgi:hypothetical protein
MWLGPNIMPLGSPRISTVEEPVSQDTAAGGSEAVGGSVSLAEQVQAPGAVPAPASAELSAPLEPVDVPVVDQPAVEQIASEAPVQPSGE